MAKKRKGGMSLGKGGRFTKLKNKLKKKGYTEEQAKKIAASIGFKKYGKKRMLEWARRERNKKK